MDQSQARTGSERLLSELVIGPCFLLLLLLVTLGCTPSSELVTLGCTPSSEQDLICGPAVAEQQRHDGGGRLAAAHRRQQRGARLEAPRAGGLARAAAAAHAGAGGQSPGAYTRSR